MAIKLEGMSEFLGALKTAQKAVDLTTKAATAAAAHLLEARIKVELTRSSHAKGTPTPSRAGEAPSLVSGRLRNSVRVKGPTKLADDTWQAQVGPTAVYSRIQELGGETGPVVLPARPYVAPSLKELSSNGKLAQVYMDAWRTVWR